MENEFNIISGKIKFSKNNTNYQFRGEARVASYDIFLNIKGSTNGRPIAKLSSNPYLSNDKILLLLTTGDDVNVSATDSINNFLKKGIILDNFFSKKTGIDLNIASGNTDADSNYLPAIKLNKRFGNNVSLGYKGNVADDKETREVDLQYNINRNIKMDMILKNDEENLERNSTKASVGIKFNYEF